MADRKVLTRPNGAVGVVTQSDKIVAGGVKTTTDATDVSVEATGAGSSVNLIANLDALFTARGVTTPLSSAADDELIPAFTRRNIIGALNQIRESYNAILSDVISANALDQVMDQFTTDGDGGIEWFYYISNGARIRAGKLMVAWDESLGTVEILDTHTPDSVSVTITFSVYHDGTDLFLMATETSGLEYQFYSTKVSPDGRYVTVSESPSAGNLQSVLNAGSIAVIDTDIDILISDSRDGVGSSNAVKELVTVRNEGVVGASGKEAQVEHRVECTDDGGLNAGNAGHRYDSKVKSGESLSFYEIFAEWSGKLASFRVENFEGDTLASATADVVQFKDVNLSAPVPVSQSGVSALTTTAQSLVGAINEANAAAGATPAHNTTHQNNGSDEISVTGLSGVLATAQATNVDGITMGGVGSAGDKLRSIAGLQNAWDYGRSINSAYGPLLSTWDDPTTLKRFFAWFAGTNQVDAVSNGAFSSFTVTGPTTFFTGWTAADYNNVFHASPTPSPEGGSTSKGTPYYAQVVTDQMIPATLTQAGSLTIGGRYRVSGWVQYRQPTSPPAEPNNGSASVIFGGVTVGTTYENAVWFHFDQEVVALGPDIVCSVDGYGVGFSTSVRSGLFSFISAIPLDTPHGVVQVDGEGNSLVGSRASDVFGATIAAASTSGGNEAFSRFVVGDATHSSSMGLELLSGVTYGRISAAVVSLQDQYTAPILLADVLNTEFITTNKTIIGAVNEAVAGAGVFTSGTGTLSALRTGSGCVVSGDYSFAVGQSHNVSGTHNVVGGQSNNLDATSSWNIVGGSSIELVGSANNLVSGNYNRLSGNAWTNSVSGSNNQVRTNFVNGSLAGNIISGSSHNLMSIASIFGSTEYCAQNAVSGYGNLVYGCSNSNFSGNFNKGFLSAYSVISGTSNRVGGANSSAVFGYDNRNSPFNVGSSISFNLVGSIVTLTDSSNPFNSTVNNQYMNIYGTSSNNGGFIVTYINSSQVSYTNAAGATEAGTDFTGWRVATSNYSYSLVAGSYNRPGSLNDCIVVGNGIEPYTSNDFGTYSHSGSAIFGNWHRYRAGWSYSQVSGYGHNLADFQYSSVSGQNITSNSAVGSTYCSSIAGEGHTVDNLRYSVVAGYSNTVTDAHGCLISGRNITSTDYTADSCLLGSSLIFNGGYNTLVVGYGHSSSAAYQVDYSLVGGHSNTLTDGGNCEYNIVGGQYNVLHGCDNTLIAGSSHDVTVSGGIVVGESHVVRGWYHAIMGGAHTVMGDSAFVAGFSNNVGQNAQYSSVTGWKNTLSLCGVGNNGNISFTKDGDYVILTDSNSPFFAELAPSFYINVTSASGVNDVSNVIATRLSSSQVRYYKPAGADESADPAHSWNMNDDSYYTAVSGRQNHVRNSESALVSGFGNNVVSGNYSLVSGRNHTVSSGDSVVTGSYASAYNPAVQVHSGGPVGPNGLVGQMLAFPYSGYTTDGTWTELSLTGMAAAEELFILAPETAYLLTLDCLARCRSGSSSSGAKSWVLKCMINNNEVVGTPVAEIISSNQIANEVDWDVRVSVNSGNLVVEALGFPGEEIYWQCSVRGSEVGTVAEV